MTLQEILDLWIEKGAVYDGEKVEEAYQFEHYHKEFRNMEVESGGIGRSINDILYGDSNFWEVMFPGKEYETYDFGTLPYHKLMKMESTPHKDKVEYLSNLLKGQD